MSLQKILSDLDHQLQFNASPKNLRAILSPFGMLKPQHVTELIQQEQRFLWRRNAGKPAEDYIRDFPEFAQTDSFTANVVLGEIAARRQTHQRVRLEEFIARFPALTSFISLSGWDTPKRQQGCSVRLWIKWIHCTPSPSTRLPA